MTTIHQPAAPYREYPRRAPDRKKTGLRVDIILGMPKYKCRFHGICRIEADEEELLEGCSTNCCRSKGKLFYHASGGCLLYFEKAGMSARTRRYHFSGNWFWLREGLELPESVCRALDLDGAYLLPGRYRLLEDRRFYRIYIYTRKRNAKSVMHYKERFGSKKVLK
ncbi:hypothetical protein [Flavilitoribacter nigricans]|uniref:Uncharacterized protein n=1 Tax=Flavilitoribacter nigricans (strain ATCC 23147 / DSM 23189 / NBRC 102662 / NCIMB 1420 / SS-2) TaxID=1122177 RepID=A0A2D0N8R5_FLAN2|nr:hypothetical protein [Flavilitoribacter nigricans]PHN04788.1 hypothetical protein CRP01_19955 [Flavilitoribacter nigricans DSM 23189 = NBRC 102662]